MRRAAVLLAAVLAAAGAARAEPEATAVWRGFPTTCAEMDNVVVAIEAARVRRFEIEARHPAYLAGLAGDAVEPDFTACDFPDETIHQFDPFVLVLHEDERLFLVGWRFRLSWQPTAGAFVVGDRRVEGLHLTQLFMKTPRGPVEVLVLYPSDGYWRARPLPPPGRAETAYGASFLIGPIDDSRHRPFVRLSEIVFDPATVSYRLVFAEGGSATVRLESLSDAAQRLSVALDLPPGRETLAVYSSMHVAPDNADVSRLAWRPGGRPLWLSAPIERFGRATGAEFAFGRDAVSRHNSSAPDTIFRAFATE
jgi:hypothetical protein